MNAAKTTSERVQAMRAARDALGLKRLELYAHPDDWPVIKALADKLHLPPFTGRLHLWEPMVTSHQICCQR